MTGEYTKELGYLEKARPGKTSLKVLLIEDDEDDFILIRDFLLEIKGVDFEMDWISHYEEAVDALKGQRHDICLLDYRLNQHDGFEILGLANKEKWAIPIIFLTGQGEYQVDLRAMQEGVADYLVKDQINPPLLERSIRYAIERSLAKRALEKAYDEMEQKVIDRTAALADANKKLRMSSEKIQHFAYSVSHDLKSPAVGIYGLTHRLYNEYSNKLDEKGKRYCEHILHAAEQITTLVEQINLYIATKELPLNCEEVKLGDICKSIWEEFSPQLELRKIRWYEPNDNPVIHADRLSITRAIRNLVDNALKYGGEDLSQINIHYAEAKEHHIISVKDDGDGLREEDPQKIFGLFFREKRSGSKTPDGTGLGLAIVKEIVERHLGEVWAESGRHKGASISMSIFKGL